MTRTPFAGARIIDGTGAAEAVADIVVEDGRILEVGPGLDADERADLATLAERVEAVYQDGVGVV